MTTAALFLALFSIQVPSLPAPEPLQHTSSLSDSIERASRVAMAVEHQHGPARVTGPPLRCRKWVGVLVGAAIGGAAGSFAGAAVYTPNYAFTQTQLVWIGGAIGAGVGAWAGHAVCGG